MRSPGMSNWPFVGRPGIKSCLVGTILTITIIGTPAWALTILSPRPGEQVLPGQSVWLIVQSDGEREADVRTLEILTPGATGCEKVAPAPLIQCELTVSDKPDKVFSAIDIRVRTTLGNGTERRASTHIKVGSTPAFNALWSDLGDRPLTFDFVGQAKPLNVFGTTVEGAKRQLREGDQGTAFIVDNPAIVRLRSDGNFIAEGVGSATITVQNGDVTLDIPVIVRAKKPRSR